MDFIYSRRFDTWFKKWKKNRYNYKRNFIKSSIIWNFIWPLFTIIRGLTSNDKNEIKECLNLLVESGKNSGFIHESYHVDDVNNFTRDWFAWANSFFGLFIEKISIEYPDLIF